MLAHFLGLLSESVAVLPKKPQVFIQASGMSYYGFNDSANLHDETSPMGPGFLAHICKEWEGK